MAIRFPKMHIAESVVNRILNTHDEVQSGVVTPTVPQPAMSPMPADPTLEGAVLESQLVQAPTEPVAAPESQDATQLLQQGILSDVFR